MRAKLHKEVVTHKPLHIQPGELRCPRCFHKDIVPSLPRGWRDSLMRWFGRIPRHCRFCEKRFYVPMEHPVRTAPTRTM